MINYCKLYFAANLESNVSYFFYHLAKGEVHVWGSNGEGQCGLDRKSGTTVPVPLKFDEKVEQISCGYYHSAVVTGRLPLN